MVINFAAVLTLGILLLGVLGFVRGVRIAALTTAAVFFALVVIIFSGGILISGFRRVGLPISGIDGESFFLLLLFIFSLSMATLVLRRIIAVPDGDVSRHDKGWGFVLGLLNGFLIMAVIEHYIAQAAQAALPPGSPVQVGIPSLAFGHPAGNTWSISLLSTPFTLMPAGSNADLWTKIPMALLLLLLFLGFVFVGTVYGRLSRGRQE